MYRKALFYVAILLSLFLVSCGTSTGSRYLQGKEYQKEEKTDTTRYPENFDLTKYHSKIEIKGNAKAEDSSAADVWYSYDASANTSDTAHTIIKTMPGYRVLVLSTDNLDEANNMRSEIYFKSDHAAVYVIFDPPFYKVEAGDFSDINDAQSFNFKLKQMGYNEVRVVKETINKFK
jgi:hypothetical protein